MSPWGARSWLWWPVVFVGWTLACPCGCWTVGADGKATCRVPAES